MSFWKLFPIPLALCALSQLAAGALFADAVQTVRVRAHVDGRSRIVLAGATAQWQHFEFAAPGRIDCDIGFPIEPTYVDGVAWYPVWPDAPNCENRDCFCSSNVYTGIAPPLPAAEANVALGLIATRGACTVVETPSAANGYAVVVEFDDNALDGAFWYEVDVVVGGCGSVVRYCDSTPNSSGLAAQIQYVGSLDVARNEARLVAVNCPPGHVGMFFYGLEQFMVPFGDGYLCICPHNPGLFRLFPPVTVDAGGSARRSLDFTALSPSGTIAPGSSWNFQFWFRDWAAGGSGTNLSDAVRVTFCP